MGQQQPSRRGRGRADECSNRHQQGAVDRGCSNFHKTPADNMSSFLFASPLASRLARTLGSKASVPALSQRCFATQLSGAIGKRKAFEDRLEVAKAQALMGGGEDRIAKQVLLC